MKIKLLTTTLITFFLFQSVFAQWEIINSGITESLNDISFAKGQPNPYLGSIVGTNRSLYQTTNGVSFQDITTPPLQGGCPTCHWTTIDFVDTFGFVGGGIQVDSATILKSDNGYDWTRTGNAPVINMNDVFFISETNGYSVGNGNGSFGGLACFGAPDCKLYLYSTSNGGNSWVSRQVAIGHSAHLVGNAVFFPNEDTGYVVAGAGTIGKTVNGGTNWTEVIPGLSPNLQTTYRDVYFTSGKIGCVVGSFSSEGIIIYTSDGGTTWDSTVVPEVLNAVYMTNDSTIYVGGQNGALYTSTNAGATWTKENLATTETINSITFTNHDSTGYAVGANGLLIIKNPPASFKISFTSSASGTICEETSVIFTNQSTFANNFKWYVGGNLESTEEDFNYTFDTAGSFDIKLVGDSGSLIDSSEVTIQVIADPDPIFTVSHDTIDKNTNLAFINTTPDINNYMYEWLVDGIEKGTNNDFTFNFTDTGNYQVALSALAMNSCRDTFYHNIVVTENSGNTTIEKLGLGNLVIFPNPIDDNYFFVVNHLDKGNLTLKLYNLYGQNVLSKRVYDKGANKIQLPADIKSGIYFVEFRSKDILLYSNTITIQ